MPEGWDDSDNRNTRQSGEACRKPGNELLLSLKTNGGAASPWKDVRNNYDSATAAQVTDEMPKSRETVCDMRAVLVLEPLGSNREKSEIPLPTPAREKTVPRRMTDSDDTGRFGMVGDFIRDEIEG